MQNITIQENGLIELDNDNNIVANFDNNQLADLMFNAVVNLLSEDLSELAVKYNENVNKIKLLEQELQGVIKQNKNYKRENDILTQQVEQLKHQLQLKANQQSNQQIKKDNKLARELEVTQKELQDYKTKYKQLKDKKEKEITQLNVQIKQKHENYAKTLWEYNKIAAGLKYLHKKFENFFYYYAQEWVGNQAIYDVNNEPVFLKQIPVDNYGYLTDYFEQIGVTIDTTSHFIFKFGSHQLGWRMYFKTIDGGYVDIETPRIETLLIAKSDMVMAFKDNKPMDKNQLEQTEFVKKTGEILTDIYNMFKSVEKHIPQELKNKYEQYYKAKLYE